MLTEGHLARAFWTLFEPIHAVSYFSAESRQAFADIGLPRYWDGYFAGRSAPLGEVSSAPVVAMFGGFAPSLVHRSLPAVWGVATVAQSLEARLSGAEACLRRVVPDEGVVELAAVVLAAAAAKVDTIGRPLSAANRTTCRPESLPLTVAVRNDAPRAPRRRPSNCAQ